jgi:hypothetical protein
MGKLTHTDVRVPSCITYEPGKSLDAANMTRETKQSNHDESKRDIKLMLAETQDNVMDIRAFAMAGEPSVLDSRLG